MTPPPDTAATPPPPADSRLHWLRALAVLLLAGSLAADAWLAMALLPGGDQASPWLRWPHDWHAWLTRASLLFMAALAWAMHARRDGLLRWWDRATAQQRALALCAPLLALEAGFGIGFWLTRESGIEQLGYLRAFFWLDAENRPAAWFSGLQWWLLAGVAWSCQRACHRAGMRRTCPAIAAAAGLYLGADELFHVHEAVGEWLSARSPGDGAAANVYEVGPVKVYGWTLVYGPLALLTGLLLARPFWRELPRDGSFRLLVAAALVFIGGAVGMETLNSHGQASGWHLPGSATQHAMILVEEVMEMVGVTLALFVFLRWRLALALALAQGPLARR